MGRKGRSGRPPGRDKATALRYRLAGFGRYPDAAVARALGISRQAVSDYRRRLGGHRAREPGKSRDLTGEL